MRKNIRRIKDKKNLFIKKKGKIIKVSKKEVFEEYKVDELIRFRKNEFKLLKKHKLLTHFNLQGTNHQKGKKYLLMLIVKPGFFNGKKEKPPIVSFKNAPVGICLSVKNNVPYEKLAARDFRYSFEHIKNVGQLKKAILKRYCQSLPHLTAQEILSLGVSITKLRIQKN